MIKVLHLLASNSYSGAENVACQIIDIFDNEKEFNMVYCSPKGPIKQKIEEKKIEYIEIERLSIYEVKRIIKEYSPNVIHAHDTKATVIAALCINKNIKLISHIHNNFFSSNKFSIRSILYLLISNKIQHIFWVSEAAMKGYSFNNKIEEKSSVLQNVIDTKKIYEKALLDSEKNGYDIVYLGRLTDVKNPLRLLKLVKKMSEIDNGLKVAIIGDGEMRDLIVRTIETENLKSISYLGYKSNPYGILMNSKLLMMTSKKEGLPMVVLESMALGTPVVSTSIEGLEKIVKNGINGYLLDNNDDIVKTTLKIIHNDDFRKKLSINCIKEIENNNNIKEYKKRILEIYKQ